MSVPKTARWLDLLAFLLRHRYPVTREAIFERVHGYLGDTGGGGGADERARDSARRTFERDKQELRALGMLIETVELPGAAFDEPQHGYRLAPDAFYFPYIELERGLHGTYTPPPPYHATRIEITPDELAILDRATARVAGLDEPPLSAAARSLRRKLAFDLPLSLETVERIVSLPLPYDAARALDVLQEATASRTPVRCRYYSIGRDADEEREIEPYGLLFSWGRWYCVARDRGKDARRVFRVDRMRNAEFLEGPAHPAPPTAHRFAIPDDFSIHDYLHRAPWELSDRAPVTVRVRFAFPESRWVQAQRVGEVEDALLDDGGALLRFAVRDVYPFLRWLLTFPDEGEPLAVAGPRVDDETVRAEQETRPLRRLRQRRPRGGPGLRASLSATVSRAATSVATRIPSCDRGRDRAPVTRVPAGARSFAYVPRPSIPYVPRARTWRWWSLPGRALPICSQDCYTCSRYENTQAPGPSAGRGRPLRKVPPADSVARAPAPRGELLRAGDRAADTDPRRLTAPRAEDAHRGGSVDSGRVG